MLGDRHQAEDLTHEVFVSALRRLRTDRPPIAFGPWLFRIARNAAVDVHRRAQIVRQVPLADEAEHHFGGAVEDSAEARQRLTDVLGALDGLSVQHRRILILRELEGLSNGEIAETMGLSRAAVEAMLFRARARVRQEYDELVSGRRCSQVRASLDNAQDGQMGRREMGVAARHVKGCRGCRRHAWESGMARVLLEPSAGRADGARFSLASLGVLAATLGAKLHARFVEPLVAAPALPWGRAAATLGLVALGAGMAGESPVPSPAAVAAAPLVVRAEAPRPVTGATTLPRRRTAAHVAKLHRRAPAAVPPARSAAVPARRSTRWTAAPSPTPPAPSAGLAAPQASSTEPAPSRVLLRRAPALVARVARVVEATVPPIEQVAAPPVDEIAEVVGTTLPLDGPPLP
jgi:RNA polymerase sigma factor (sigma-70 family)